MSFENNQNFEIDLQIQNTRILRKANEGEKPIDNSKFLTKIDDDLIREYKEQFDKGFEYVDETTGEKKYRKYQIPQDEPELEEPIIDDSFDGFTVQDIEEEIVKLETAFNILSDLLFKNIEKQKQLKKDIDDGAINPILGEQEQKDLFKYFVNVQLAYNKKRDYLLFYINLRDDKINTEQQNYINTITTEKKNKDKISKYKSELQILNNVAFNTEQQSNETDEDYYNRLKQNAQVETPQEILNNATKLTLKKFKEHMKELIRNESKIEQICNSIDILGAIDNKFYLLKKWELFKKQYIKIYGINNTFITASEIVDFMKEFIENDGNINQTKKEEEKEENLINSGFNDNLVYFEGKAKKENLFLKLGFLNGESYLLYSYSGDKDSFTQFTKLPKQLYNEQWQEIYKLTGLNDYDISKKLNCNRSLEGIIANLSYTLKPETELFKKPKITYNGKKYNLLGYGLDKLPEYKNLGKLLLNVHKLYYKNILSLKHHNKLSIVGLKNIKVSDKFVKIIMSLIDNITPTIHEINLLSIPEKQLYDRVIYLSNLNKSVPHTNDKTINDLKKRLKLIEGEIEAGNNNPMLLSELYVVVHSLKDFGILSPSEMKTYLKQF
jgi:L-rhamnose mutarotase